MRLLEFLAGLGADALQALAALANHHGFVAIALDNDGGCHAHETLVLLAGFFFELVDHHRGGVRQLIAREAEQLLPDRFPGQELLLGNVTCDVGVDELEVRDDEFLFLLNK